MPILASIKSPEYSWIYPTENWQKIEIFDVEPQDFNIAEHLLLLKVKKVVLLVSVLLY